MKRVFLFAAILAVLLFSITPSIFAQAGSMGLLGVGNGASAPNPTPGFVSSNISGSTVDQSVTTLVAGTATCAVNYAFCSSYPDPSLAGNSGVIFVTYGASSAEVPTITDDKSNTYTHASCESHDSANNRWGEVFYSIGLATGTRNITVTFPTTVTHAQVHAVQLYNIGSFDACSENDSTSAVTSFSAGNLTTTTGNDMALVFAVQTNPTNTFTSTNSLGPFAAAGGWSQLSNNLRDGESAALEVVSSAGTITPTITSSASAAYVANSIAFKSATAGTAPSGMYVACMGSFNSASSISTTSISEGTPCGSMTGVTISLGLGGGGTAASGVGPTAVSDGTANTYAPCAPGYTTTGNDWNATWCVVNATISNSTTPAVTMTWNGGTGDFSNWWYVIAGANTRGPVAYAQTYSSTWPGTSPLTFLNTYQPAASSSITLNHYTADWNTPVAMTSPCNLFDANFNAGENRDGPWPLDENNGRGHCTFSGSNAVQTWTITQAAATSSASSYTTNLTSFAAPGAVWMKDVAVNGQTTSASDPVINITATAAEPLIVGVGAYNGTAATISKVCLDGNSTCSTGTLLTVVPSSTSTIVTGSQGLTAVYYTGSGGTLSTVSATSHTITIVASASVANIEGVVYPVLGLTSVDLANQTQNGSVSSGVASGPSITTTGNPGFAIGLFGVSNACTAAPSSGNEYTIGSGIWTATTDCWMATITTSAAAHSPSASDSSGTFNSSNVSFK